MLFYSAITIMICPSLYTTEDGKSLVPSHWQELDWINKLRTSGKGPLEDVSETGCNFPVLMKLLEQLEWRLIIVIHDQSSECWLRDFTKQLLYLHHEIVLEFHELKDNNTRSFDGILLDVHQRLFPRLDFLLLANDVTVWNILSYVNRLDSLSNRTTDFNYHSKWLVCLKPAPIDKSVYSLDRLQNVAFIRTVCGVEIMTLVHNNTLTSLQTMSSMPKLNNSILFPALNYGYNGRKLTVSIISVSTFIQIKSTKNGTNYTGFCIYLLDALAKSLNFTYEFVEPKHGTWGVLSNGSWDGLVGVMERREADLALADLTINIDRLKVMDFILPPFYYDNADIIYKGEDINDTSSTWWTLLKPFSPMVFLVIAACSGGFFILYLLAMVLTRDRCPNRNEPRTVSDVLWYTISSLLKQGISINPSSHSIRILLSAWLLFVVIIITEYTGHLTAAFTVRPVNKRFANLRQLLDHPKYKIGMLPGTIITMVLKNSSYSEYRELWSNVVEDSKDEPDHSRRNESKQLEKIKGGNYAFINNEAALRTYMTENCGLQRLGLNLVWQPVTFGVPKNSTLNFDFHRIMLRFESSGIFDYYWKLHQLNLKLPACPSRQRHASSKINLDDIKIIFVLLAAGIAAALLVLAVEVLRNRYTCS